jgi:hypothetical protein
MRTRSGEGTGYGCRNTLIAWESCPDAAVGLQLRSADPSAMKVGVGVSGTGVGVGEGGGREVPL